MNEKELIDYLNNIDFENSDIVYNEIEKLVKENQELKLELSGYRQAILNNEEMLGLKEQNEKLKKQLEEWEHHLKCSKKMLYIQGQKGNYDYDEYMLGTYNGMEYIIALFETREPNYISGKDVEFTNNKNQQKEFIKYLEDGIEKATTNPYTKLSEYGMNRIHIYNEILQKYKEIIGDDK